MKLRDAMIQAFNWLEQNYEVKWTKGLGSKDKLIEAFSQVEVPKAKYLGFSGNDGIMHSFKRAIKDCNKPKGILWEKWLLSNINLFYCTQCADVKDLGSKSSKGYVCKECDLSRTAGIRNSNQHLVAEYLFNSTGCKDCGEKDIRCLEFDHLDPSIKDFNISDGYLKSKEDLVKEMSKCDILCANCHRKRTATFYLYYRHKYLISK